MEQEQTTPAVVAVSPSSGEEADRKTSPNDETTTAPSSSSSTNPAAAAEAEEEEATALRTNPRQDLLDLSSSPSKIQEVEGSSVVENGQQQNNNDEAATNNGDLCKSTINSESAAAPGQQGDTTDAAANTANGVDHDGNNAVDLLNLGGGGVDDSAVSTPAKAAAAAVAAAGTNARDVNLLSTASDDTQQEAALESTNNHDDSVQQQQQDLLGIIKSSNVAPNNNSNNDTVDDPVRTLSSSSSSADPSATTLNNSASSNRQQQDNKDTSSTLPPGGSVQKEEEAARNNNTNDGDTATAALGESSSSSSADDGTAAAVSVVTEQPGTNKDLLERTIITDQQKEPTLPRTSETTNSNIQAAATNTDKGGLNEPLTLSDCPEKDGQDAGGSQKERIEFLEMELAKAKALISSLQEKQDSAEETTLLMELQSNLQKQMSLKADAEDKVRIAHIMIQELEATNVDQAEALSRFEELKSSMKRQMNAKAEAENKARLLTDRIQELESQTEKQANEIDNLERQVVRARRERATQEEELQKIREQRDEQERKEIALTNRLNAAKKKEAVKANLAEQYEDDIKAVEQDLETTKQELKQVTEAKESLEQELGQLQQQTKERIHQAEAALLDERTLNEERKKKMKAFVENRAEELRQAKADNDSLQNELNQTNRSLMDLNNRWKQLHAQWVQSQTRNRELQRDLNRIKKDSENLHKVGDTLEMKLSRSGRETEEHKNKRLAAKHELMTVLRTLEAERELSAKLRDCLKFTFTPKALSQQQLLHESLEDFEAQLQKLSLRLGQPLPPASQNAAMNDMSERSESSSGDADAAGLDASTVSRSDADVQRLIDKLEYETQRVSQSIMVFSNSIERMHMVLDAGGGRTCYTVFKELVIGSVGSSPASAATHEETTSMTGSPPRRLAAIRSHRYGQVPSTSAD